MSQLIVYCTDFCREADRLPEVVPLERTQYLCFSTRRELPEPWQPLPPVQYFHCPQVTRLWHLTHPHQALPPHTESLYLAPHVDLLADPRPLLNSGFEAHLDPRYGSLIQAAFREAQQGRVSLSAVWRQLHHHSRQVPSPVGYWDTDVLLRQDTPQHRTTGERWWGLLKQFGLLDQVVLAFLHNRYRVLTELPGTLQCSPFFRAATAAEQPPLEEELIEEGSVYARCRQQWQARWDRRFEKIKQARTQVAEQVWPDSGCRQPDHRDRLPVTRQRQGEGSRKRLDGARHRYLLCKQNHCGHFRLHKGCGTGCELLPVAAGQPPCRTFEAIYAGMGCPAELPQFQGLEREPLPLVEVGVDRLPEISRPQPLGRTDLRLVTCHFNPAGYRALRRTFERWLPTLGPLAKYLHVYELVFDEDEPELEHEHHTVIRGRRDKHLMWQKEAMINRALRECPPEIRYFGWLDHDVVFRDPRWLERSLDKLAAEPGLAALQPFSHMLCLDADDVVAEKWSSISIDPVRGLPGLAWLAKREFMDQTGGLLIGDVIGGSDTPWVSGFGFDQFCRQYYWTNTKAAIEVCREHDERVRQTGQGCDAIPGIIYHLHHARREDRSYFRHVHLLTDNRFDPRQDVRVTDEGILEWGSDKPELHRGVQEFFAARGDDTPYRVHGLPPLREQYPFGFPPRTLPRSRPFGGKVGFLMAEYMPTGGGETWHRTLLPHLTDVAGLVCLDHERAGGDFEQLGCPVGVGVDAARELAASCQVLVLIGIRKPSLGTILPAENRPRVISVSHGDRHHIWTHHYMALQAPFTDYSVYICPSGRETLYAKAPSRQIVNASDPRRIVPTRSYEANREWLGIEPWQRMLLSAVRLDPIKGVDKLVEAAMLLGPDYRLVVSCADGDYGSQYERRIHALAGQQAILVAGIDPPADLYAAADAYVSASYSEGYGLSTAEAMLSGLPVISTPVGLLEEHPQLARIVSRHASVADWATGIAADFEQREEALERAQRAQQFLQQEHTVERFVAQWAGLIDQLAATNPRGSE